MTISSLLFGDVFQCNGKEYIFLAMSAELIYTAQILSKIQTKTIDALCEKRIIQNKDDIETQILYCYVKLTTADFTDRAAYLGRPANDNFMQYQKIQVFLNTKDLRGILKEIETKKVISRELKDLCKDIKI